MTFVCEQIRMKPGNWGRCGRPAVVESKTGVWMCGECAGCHLHQMKNPYDPKVLLYPPEQRRVGVR